jgi:hypothetical protein
MPDVDIAITAGSGTNVHCFQRGAGDFDQYVREAPASGVAAPSHWTISLTASTSVLAADITRRMVILWNTSATATVYLRYDTTAPTTATDGWHDKIPPGARLSFEKELTTLAVSMIGDIANGVIEICTATAG